MPFFAFTYSRPNPDGFLFGTLAVHGIRSVERGHAGLPTRTSAVSTRADLLVVDLDDLPEAPLEIDGINGSPLLHFLDATRDVAPAVILIGKEPSHAQLALAHASGVTVYTGPLASSGFSRRILTLAETGYGRRMQLDEPTRARDPRRASRPVFLSYRSADDRNRDNRRDSGIADASRRLIEAEGIPVWYARTSVHRGDVWAAEIEKGLEDALVLVCLLSEDYLTSGHTTGEHSIYRMRHSRDGKLSPTRLVVCANVGLNDDWKTRDDPLSHHTQAFRSYEPVDLQGSSIVTGVREILRRIKAHLGAQGWRPERGFVED